MKVVGCISGGKEGIYNMMLCERANHVIVCLANLLPSEAHMFDNRNMFQSAGQPAVSAIAEAMQLPVYFKDISGTPAVMKDDNSFPKNCEVKDLVNLLTFVKEYHPDVEGVSVGVISNYAMREAFEYACSRVKLIPLCLCWDKCQLSLYDTIISERVDAFVVKVALPDFTSRYLGMSLKEARDLFYERAFNSPQKAEFTMCGEEGEYRTFVVDCPLYAHRINIDQSEVILHTPKGVKNEVPVHYMMVKEWSLIDQP